MATSGILSQIGICHCRDCQIFGGSAFRAVAAVAPKNFQFTKGQPTYFEKVSGSGAIRKMAFCTSCGTHICSLPADADSEGAFVSIRIATCCGKTFSLNRLSWLIRSRRLIGAVRVPPGTRPPGAPLKIYVSREEWDSASEADRK